MRRRPTADRAGRVRRATLLVPAAAALLAAACGGSTTPAAVVTPSEPPSPTPTTAPTLPPGTTTAELSVDSGFDTVVVTTADLGRGGYQVVGQGGVVQASLVDGVLHVTNQQARRVDVTLSKAVTWRVRLLGGATTETVDLAQGGAGEVDLGAGATTVGITLPPPKGTQVVHLSGGATTVTVRLPNGAPVRVAFNGGGGTSVVDGAQQSGLPGGTVVQQDGYPSSTDRLQVDLEAGVTSFSLSRT